MIKIEKQHPGDPVLSKKGFIGVGLANVQATSRLELDNDEGYPQMVLDLACLTPDEAIHPHSIHPYIDELSDLESLYEKTKCSNGSAKLLRRDIGPFVQGAGRLC